MLLVAIWFLKLTFGPLSTSAPNVDPVRPYKMPRFTLCGPMAWAQKQCLRQGGWVLAPNDGAKKLGSGPCTTALPMQCPSPMTSQETKQGCISRSLYLHLSCWLNFSVCFLHLLSSTVKIQLLSVCVIFAYLFRLSNLYPGKKGFT